MNLDNIIKMVEDSRFCYAKEGGQGYVHKSKCTCDKINNPCQAAVDKKRFHDTLKDVEIGDAKHRNEVIQNIKPEFKDSQWWRDNVIE